MKICLRCCLRAAREEHNIFSEIFENFVLAMIKHGVALIISITFETDLKMYIEVTRYLLEIYISKQNNTQRGLPF